MTIKFKTLLTIGLFCLPLFRAKGDQWENLVKIENDRYEKKLKSVDAFHPPELSSGIDFKTSVGDVNSRSLAVTVRECFFQGKISLWDVGRGFFDGRDYVRYVCHALIIDLAKDTGTEIDPLVYQYSYVVDPIVDSNNFRHAEVCMKEFIRLNNHQNIKDLIHPSSPSNK